MARTLLKSAAAVLVLAAALIWLTAARTDSRSTRFRALRIGLGVVMTCSLVSIAVSLVAGQWSITGGSTLHGKSIHWSVRRQTYSHFTTDRGFS